MRVTIGSRPGAFGTKISPVGLRSLNTIPGGAPSPIFFATAKRPNGVAHRPGLSPPDGAWSGHADAKAEGGDHARLRPPSVGCGDESIDQGSEGAEGQHGPQPVEALPGIEVPAFRDAPQGDP